MIFAICSADDDHGDDDKKGAHAWNYDKQGGPTRWSKMFPDRCGEARHRQSPVDIETSAVRFVEDFDKVDVIYQETEDTKFTLGNNGHTIKVKIDGSVMIDGGGIGDTFKIFQLHFHWGGTNDYGSEHRIDGKTFPLEMHMVSYDAERYTSVEEALSGFNSLAVLGTLFKVVEEDNPLFDPIISLLDEVEHKGDKVEISKSSFDPVSLLPEDTSQYFRYDGSLTTPPCLENVIWTVFAQYQTIGRAQLDKFRKCFQEGDEGEEKPLVDNYRPPQPLHGREIYSSFQPVQASKEAISGQNNSAILTSSLALMAAMLAMAFL